MCPYIAVCLNIQKCKEIFPHKDFSTQRFFHTNVISLTQLAITHSRDHSHSALAIWRGCFALLLLLRLRLRLGLLALLLHHRSTIPFRTGLRPLRPLRSRSTTARPAAHSSAASGHSSRTSSAATHGSPPRPASHRGRTMMVRFASSASDSLLPNRIGLEPVARPLLAAALALLARLRCLPLRLKAHRPVRLPTGGAPSLLPHRIGLEPEARPLLAAALALLARLHGHRLVSLRIAAAPAHLPLDREPAGRVQKPTVLAHLFCALALLVHCLPLQFLLLPRRSGQWDYRVFEP